MNKKTSKKNREAMVLEELRLSATEPSLAAIVIFYFLFLALGAGASLCCFYSSFEIPISVPVAIAFFLIFTSFFTALYTMKRKNTGFVITAAGIGALFALIFRSSIYRGFLILVKYIVQQFREKGSAVTFPSEWSEYIKNADYGFDSTVLLIVFMYAFIFLEAWAIIKRRNLFLAAIATIPLILVPVTVPITPNPLALALLFSFYGMSLFLSPVINGNAIFRRGFKGYHISAPSAATPSAFSAVSILLALMLIIYMIFPASAFSRPELLDAVRLSILNGFDSTEISRYFSASLGGDISSVNLKDLGDISFEDKPVLKLTLTDSSGLDLEIGSHSEYIKSYVGSVYSEDGWSLLSKDKSEEVNNILGDSCSQRIFDNVRKIFYQSVYFNGYAMTAQWCSAGDPRLLYTPYNLADISPKDGISYVDDGYITAADESSGLESYSYSAYSSVSFENSTLEDLVSEMYREKISGTDFYDIEDYREGVAVDGGTLKIDDDGYIIFIDEYGNMYNTGQQVDVSEYYGSIDEKSDEISTSGMISELYNKNVITRQQYNYLNSLMSYNSFVEETYTQLPDDEKSFLKDFIEEKNIRTGSVDEAVADVMELLISSGEYEYTLSPGNTPDDEDFVEYFLTQNKKGYCRYFATSAVLLLRAAGIPARYAEGFKLDSSELLEEGTVELLDSDAHAWVEIYYSGTGWTALDFTPSASSSSGESSVLESSTPESSAPESSESESSLVSDESAESVISSDSADETQSRESTSEISSVSSESDSMNHSIITYILFVPMCAVIVFITLWLNRFVRIKRRKSRFKSMDEKAALLEVYSYIVRLLLYRESCDEAEGDYDNIKKLIESEDVSKEKKRRCESFLNEIYPLAQKAKFSSGGVSKDELEAVLSYYRELYRETMDKLSFIQRLAAEYLDIL